MVCLEPRLALYNVIHFLRSGPHPQKLFCLENKKYTTLYNIHFQLVCYVHIMQRRYYNFVSTHEVTKTLYIELIPENMNGNVMQMK